MKRLQRFFSLIVFQFAGYAVCAQTGFADKIFINGKVLTVDSLNTVAQAVALKGGRIIAVGTNARINKLKGKNTEVADLKGKTLTPGFIDGHSHFMGLGQLDLVNISAPPVGNVKKIADIINEIRKFKEERKIGPGEWITAYGYDQDQLVEKRHPVREDIDAAFPDNPVLLGHISGHMLVANSAALKISGVTAATKDPEGGVIIRRQGSTEPAGLLQENAQGLVMKELNKQKASLEKQLDQVKRQQQFYASFGITTAQDGFTSEEGLALLRQSAARKDLVIDVVALPSFVFLDKILADSAAYVFGTYNNRLKLDGIKLSSDGSPQGKTAYFTQPYLTLVPGCEQHCTGVPTLTQEKFNSVVLKCFQHNLHLYTHCNGDGAIDMYIQAVENANRTLNTTSINRRTVVIHSQFVREDQLDKYKELGLLPSFFTNHAFFWGDVHVQNLGLERASFLSPLKTSLNKGLIFINHTDYPVTPVNQLFLLWSAVNRVSRSGSIIGPDERVSPAEALRAITINGAYQYAEEKSKGSIEEGKLADLVVLSADPLTAAPDKIKDITVLETIKEGKTIYKR